MNILLVYSSHTMKRYQASFLENHPFFEYCNNENNTCTSLNFSHTNGNKNFSKALNYTSYDIIIFQPSFSMLRVNEQNWNSAIKKAEKYIKNSQAVKIFIPQNEFLIPDSLTFFIQRLGIDIVYSCATYEDRKVLYPELADSDSVDFIDGYSSYLLKNERQKIEEHREELIEKSVWLGHYSTRQSFLQGNYGKTQDEWVENMKKACSTHSYIYSSFLPDISSQKNVFTSIYNKRLFLLSCRAMFIFSEGSSLLIPNTEVYYKLLALKNAQITKPSEDINVQLYALYQKNNDGILHSEILPSAFFDCVSAGVCPVLIEGNYGNGLTADVHYIEVKRDFSNIDTVLSRLENHSLCRKIANTVYTDFVETESAFSYTYFISNLLDRAKSKLEKRIITPSKNSLFSKVRIFLNFNIKKSHSQNRLLKSSFIRKINRLTSPFRRRWNERIQRITFFIKEYSYRFYYYGLRQFFYNVILGNFYRLCGWISKTFPKVTALLKKMFKMQ